MTAVSIGVERPAGPGDCSPERALELLSGTAVALGHDVDLDSLLADLAMGVRRILDADRVSLLLLEGDRLTPAVSVARRHDEDLWQRFRRMPPIPFDDVPGAREAVARGSVLFIPDASASPLVPAAWQRAFGLVSLTVAPLVVGGLPAGVLSVEYADQTAAQPPGQSPAQLALLEGMAGLAGVALSHGRQRAHAQRLSAATALLQRLALTRTPRAVAEMVLDALCDTVKVGNGMFALLQAEQLELVALRGQHVAEPGHYALAELPPSLVKACRERWALDQSAPVGVDLHGQPLTVVPCPGSQAPAAAAVLPVSCASLRPDALAELRLVAGVAASALHRVALVQERDWHRAALALLTAGERESDEPGATARAVSGVCALLRAAGVDLPRVVVDRSSARALELPAATGEAARQLTRWRRLRGSATPVHQGEHHLAPLCTTRQVVGALLWRAPAGAATPAAVRDLLPLLGALLGLARADERVRDLERRQQVAAAHREIASHAYHEAQLLLGTLSQARYADDQARAATESVVTQTRRLLRDGIDALAPAPVRSPDLRSALTLLARQVSAQGGPETVVRHTGRSVHLTPGAHVALVRATGRLLRLLRESRSAAAVVHLECRSADVVVTVHADELLAGIGTLDVPGLPAALRDVRAWLRPVAGELERERIGPVNRFTLRLPLVPTRRGVPPPGDGRGGAGGAPRSDLTEDTRSTESHLKDRTTKHSSKGIL